MFKSVAEKCSAGWQFTAGHQRGAFVEAIIDDFQQIAFGLVGQRRQSGGVQDEQLELRQVFEQLALLLERLGTH